MDTGEGRFKEAKTQIDAIALENKMTDKILVECRRRAKSLPTKSGFRRKVVTLRDIESILASQPESEDKSDTEESKETDHRPNCIPSVYGRTEDPTECICHSWSNHDKVQRTGDEPI